MKMEGEGQAPKGGGRVGGFLQLFDWNGKSRKKLFSSKSDIPEHPKQGKKSKGNFPTTRIRLLDEDEIGATASVKGSSCHSCASSVTDEEGYGNKAPGVVARLMGLESLPTSTPIEPYFSPFFDTQSLDEAPFRRKGKFVEKAEDFHRHPKSLSRALEKFQKENLPPRSAKSIPITQHKIMSPIKNPRYIRSTDPADIMEAASKIVGSRPQATTTARTRLSLVGTSSAPLKVRELKENMAAASQRPIKASCSASTKNKGKSINLAIQAKVNVQRREGMNPRRDSMEGRRDSDSKKEFCSQKMKARKNSSVLRENSRKQNCNPAKENVQSKSVATDVHGRKIISRDLSHGRQRNLNKCGSKKSSLEAWDGHMDDLHSGPRNVPRKKRIIDGNLQGVRYDSDHSVMSQSNSARERRSPWTEEAREEEKDVVSFTFTTTMTRSMGDSLSVLIEQKLRELKNGMQPSMCNFIPDEASATSSSCTQNSSTFFGTQDKTDQKELHMDSSKYSQMLSSFSSAEAEVPRRRHELEGGEMDQCSSTKVQTGQLYNHRHPSPISILDSYDLSETCNSSHNTESNTTEESKQQCSSDTQMDDASEVTYSNSNHSTEWELDYIKDILSNVELMFKDYASGRTRDIINPHLFDQLERKRWSSSSYKDIILAEKKALFDSVSECLGWRCERFVGGGFSAWEKGLSVVRRKEKLVKEVYMEIQGYRSMRSCIVDEIVDKDMSIPNGRWMDFEDDGFGIAVDVETLIFDDLVDEVVADVLAVGWRFKGKFAFL